MHTQWIEQLHTLKLTGMATALSLQWEQPTTYADLSFEERLGMLIEREVLDRENRRLKPSVADS
uniref:IstB-like ATP binding N-terminal n=1 Tax=Candidatus Kentrum sp. TUN TaxID=2126343 RepID=A0A451A5N2_9GAMM|nr:MAG: IstB-like ATP binding N-terminal [Candidatus Kentron sp. TUN]VFK70250.1 MAG: IstB-like ATP binding N-terminal [Candidatus Kentron sp. TUN]